MLASSYPRRRLQIRHWIWPDRHPRSRDDDHPAL